MNRYLSRLLDDYYWTTRWIATGIGGVLLSLWLGRFR